MKQFIKVFLISLAIFSTVIITGVFTYAKFTSPEGMTPLPDEENPIAADEEEDDDLTPGKQCGQPSGQCCAFRI